jgi:hypothetical protein
MLTECDAYDAPAIPKDVPTMSPVGVNVVGNQGSL